MPPRRINQSPSRTNRNKLAKAQRRDMNPNDAAALGLGPRDALVKRAKQLRRQTPSTRLPTDSSQSGEFDAPRPQLLSCMRVISLRVGARWV
jgi:hypothetical protein